jgi:hypothetical protein
MLPDLFNETPKQGRDHNSRSRLDRVLDVRFVFLLGRRVDLRETRLYPAREAAGQVAATKPQRRFV